MQEHYLELIADSHYNNIDMLLYNVHIVSLMFEKTFKALLLASLLLG